MADPRSLPATQGQIEDLSAKLDAILFAQTEILLRQRQKADESLHAPLYIWEALMQEVGMVQEEVDEAVKIARAHLEKLRQARR